MDNKHSILPSWTTTFDTMDRIHDKLDKMNVLLNAILKELENPNHKFYLLSAKMK